MDLLRAGFSSWCCFQSGSPPVGARGGSTTQSCGFPDVLRIFLVIPSSHVPRHVDPSAGHVPVACAD
jgi:hypothetical protein